MSLTVFALLVTLLPAQPRRIDLSSEPWASVLTAQRERGDDAAHAELEHAARSIPGPAWIRAHAWRWAGQLAMRRGRHETATRDFEAAVREDPGGFEGRMARVHLAEVAIRQRRWYLAEERLVPLENDPDRIVAAYARARLRAVRERTRRLTLRWVSLALLVVGALLLVVRLARRARRRGTARSFARALLGGEALAIAGALVVPRWTSSLAAPGWMAFAVPAALVGSALWATREASAPYSRRAGVLAAFVLACAAGLYLALDLTWWSQEHPLP